jgi:hypothetical protein
MSYPVFPNIAPPNGAFGWPIKRTPRFKTLQQPSANMRGDLAISLSAFPQWDFEFDVTWLPGDETPAQSASAFQSLLGIFGQGLGAGAPWLFTHPYDNAIPTSKPASCLNSVNGGSNGDGSTTTFLMTRQIGALQDWIQNFTGAPSIYVNGALQASGYSIDSYGNLTFTTAPTSGYAVQWAGAFYYLCRFDEDTLSELQEALYQLWTLSSLKFHSILL